MTKSLDGASMEVWSQALPRIFRSSNSSGIAFTTEPIRLSILVQARLGTSVDVLMIPEGTEVYFPDKSEATSRSAGRAIVYLYGQDLIITIKQYSGEVQYRKLPKGTPARGHV